MKHRVVGRRLDRTTEHRTAMLRNMVTSLIRHERIVTTTPKAKELKRFADKVITLGKRGTSHARRVAHREVRDIEVLDKLFGAIAERFKARPGGYTRLVRVGRRPGDNAEMALIELVDRAGGAAAGGEPAAEEAAPRKAQATKEKAAAKAEKPKAEKGEKAEKAPRGKKKAKAEE